MIEWITHRSQCLEGFPMRDRTERSFPIYLPPGYSKNPAKGYPVFFLLAGYSGRGSAYLADNSAFGTPLQHQLDVAIQETRLPPCIVVFPDFTSRLGCSQYVNSTANGRYMDYLCDELVPFIDEKYPTRRDRKYRGVAGHSSGGFGALVTAMLRPDVFSVICSSAGDSFYEVSLLKQINAVIIEVERAGGLEAFVKRFFEFRSASTIPSSSFDCMLTLQMASCYAPNPGKPPIYGDLFFDLKTGEVIPEIWEKYLAWDPVRMVEQHQEALRKAELVLLESGLQDEHALQLGHRQLAARFQKYGVRHEIVEYPGTHSGHHWRFESRLIRLSRAMGL